MSKYKDTIHEGTVHNLKTIYEKNYVDTVRHGRWIREPNCYYRCSVCGDHHPCIKSNMDYNYCPNCGAKMDEVNRE